MLSKKSNPDLNDILKDPMLLMSFEKYLKSHMSQENLLFIEAVNQLRYGASEYVEETLLRIYYTFIDYNSPMELNVDTQSIVKKRIAMYPLSLITREQALELLKETEDEVLDILANKLEEFYKTPLANESLKQSKIHSNFTYSLQKKVVIIGGGFTGFTVASILDPMSLFHVTLIDTKCSFEYTPQIVVKLVNPEKCSSSLRFAHTSYVKNGKVIIGYAEDINHDAKCVVVNGEEVYFDYLVIATGSSYTGQLKSTDASTLYRTVGLNNLATAINDTRKILIIGAGLVGCELSAAIAKKKFDSVYPKKEITMVEARSQIIYRCDQKQRRKAEKFLHGLGVTIYLNERINAVHVNGVTEYHGSSGRIYSSKEYLVIIATGVTVNTNFIKNSTNEPSLDICLDSNDHIRVRNTLQIDHWKYNHIFAGGDATNIVEEKTAYSATLAGVCIARNICRLEKGKEPIPQGSKGLLPPPSHTLHGIKSQGGIGKQKLSFFERKFSFLNTNWQILKYFNEKQFFKIIQETGKNSNLIGRLPKALSLPDRNRSRNDSWTYLFEPDSNFADDYAYDHQSIATH